MAVKSVGNQVGAAATGSSPDALVQDTRKTSKVKEAAQNAYARAAKKSESSAAEVSISPRARELAAANRIARETPDVREDKVEHFKKLIADGSYKPDAGKIADGIAREAIKDELAASPELALDDNEA